MKTHTSRSSVALGAILLLSPMQNIVAASNDNTEQQPIALIKDRVIHSSDLQNTNVIDDMKMSRSLSEIAYFVVYVERMIINEEIEARNISVSTEEIREAVIKSLESMNVTEITFPAFKKELQGVFDERLQTLQNGQHNSSIPDEGAGPKSTDVDARHASKAEIRDLKDSIPNTFNDLVQQSFRSTRRMLEIERLTSSLIESQDIDNNDQQIHEGRLFRDWLNSRMQKLDITFYCPKLEDAWKSYFIMLNGKVENMPPRTDTEPDDFDLPSPETIE